MTCCEGIMKFLILLIFVTIFTVNAQRNKIDNVDVEMVLKNDRILNSYIKCILDKGPCTNEGKELKMVLPEVRF